MPAIYKETVLQLTPIYGGPEANSITNILFEDLLHIDRIKRLTNTNMQISETQKEILNVAISRLLKNEPIQHIVGYTHFFGRSFQVNQHTLVPRPETEELVNLIIGENKTGKPTILDIGTGTGCIAISLELEIHGSNVTGVDLSEEALQTAKMNAKALGAHANFIQMDILNNAPQLRFDIIVSNPPYIPMSDKKEMHPNVLKYDPGSALFVPDDDPLIFYHRIAELGKISLNKGGKVYLEIHENFGEEIKNLLRENGYENIQVLKDLNGKNRMVSARLG
ncbi:MAG: peptide chain release factor N(5)-glutamine methyltransferase [Marinoscillum sp.]